MIETKKQWLYRILKESIIPFKRKEWEYIDNGNMSIMTFNLRGDRFKDKSNSWINRRNSIIDMIKDKVPDVICCQETMSNMAKFLKAEIGCNYNCYGVGTFIGVRLDKTFIPTMGNIIFVKKNKFDIIEKNVFWLSDNSKFPSKTWGNKEHRNCIMVRLMSKIDGTIYTVFNTHFDHTSKEARNKSTDLVIKHTEKYNDSIIYIVGDLNATISNDELTGFNDFIFFPKKDSVKTTFNGFNGNKKIVCDYIITNDDINQYELEVITDSYGVPYLSDHYPVLLK